ncbi:MAG: hypothetical protein QGE95_12515, partial [Arenicellales bacterium]|nr:hypothetical protein [Arenicellales bacterium]
MPEEKPDTLGALRKSDFQIRSVKEEMRRNLMSKLADESEIFPDIIGYDNSVLPQLANAILSGQDIILLGERGQAKSKIIRSLTSLLDEWTPIIADVEIPENPFAPISMLARNLVAEKGDDTPITWI